MEAIVTFNSKNDILEKFNIENTVVNFFMLTKEEREKEYHFTNGKAAAIAEEKITGNIYVFIAGEGKGILIRKKEK